MDDARRVRLVVQGTATRHAPDDDDSLADRENPPRA
jgi:hypothetical protein